MNSSKGLLWEPFRIDFFQRRSQKTAPITGVGPALAIVFRRGSASSVVIVVTHALPAKSCRQPNQVHTQERQSEQQRSNKANPNEFTQTCFAPGRILVQTTHAAPLLSIRTRLHIRCNRVYNRTQPGTRPKQLVTLRHANDVAPP